MAQATLTQLENIISTYVDASKQTQKGFTASTDDLTGLLDKIAMTITMDTAFYDSLPELDGEKLEWGATIEEYFEDLTKPVDFDPTGANNNSPAYPTYRPVLYDYPLGLKTFKKSISYVKYKKACLNSSVYAQLVANNYKKLEDSIASYKMFAKLGLMGNFIIKVEAVFSGASTLTANTAYSVGAYVKDASHYGVVVKAIPNTNTETDVADLPENIVILDNLAQVLAVPEDTSTGEAFIKQLKKDITIAKRPNEQSLSGGAIGAEQGLVLYLKEGVLPSIEVDTLAGAFNQERLAVPVEIKEVKDFGQAYSGKTYALLMDRRAIRLHNNEDLSLNFVNADGAFINIVRHLDFTGFISGNCFVKIYQDD